MNRSFELLLSFSSLSIHNSSFSFSYPPGRRRQNKENLSVNFVYYQLPLFFIEIFNQLIKMIVIDGERGRVDGGSISKRNKCSF